MIALWQGQSVLGNTDIERHSWKEDSIEGRVLNSYKLWLLVYLEIIDSLTALEQSAVSNSVINGGEQGNQFPTPAKNVYWFIHWNRQLVFLMQLWNILMSPL